MQKAPPQANQHTDNYHNAVERDVLAAIRFGDFRRPREFQLGDPAGTGEPQAMLREFAEKRGIPLLDLLPIFASESRLGNETEPSTDGGLFLDPSHLSPRGSRVAAAAIAGFLATRGP